MSLADMLVLGDEDWAAGRLSYERSCELGDAEGCHKAAMLFMGVSNADGIRVLDRDLERAASLLQQSCEGEYGTGCLALFRIWSEAELGEFPDLTSTFAIFEERCDPGVEGSCSNAALLWLRGRGKMQDFGRARGLLERGCENGSGDAEACFLLALLHKDGVGGSQDLTRTVELYQLSCDGGSANACTNLGMMYYEGDGVQKDRSRAALLYEKSCDSGLENGCYALGHLYQEGEGVARDRQKAASLYQEACDGGFGLACYSLADMYERGRGVSRDRDRASELRQRACQLGYSRACR
jgi:TPR repeat protein